MDERLMTTTCRTLLTLTILASAGVPVAAEPDVIIGSIPNAQHWTSAGPVEGLRAYSYAKTPCNVGTSNLDWFVGPDPRHIVTAPNLYRLKGGRFEQIGQGWVMHGFCALQQSLCGSCAPPCGGCCSALGPGCSDTGSATSAGQMSFLGPRSEINAHEGTNLGDHAFPTGNPSLRGRLLVRDADLAPALNPNASYFAELQAIAADDARASDMTGDNNNASHRRVSIVWPTGFLAFDGGTMREQPAIHAWQVDDPEVSIQNIDIPDEGRLILAYRVTDNGDGTWHYEYALHNLNSDRSAGSFAVPIPEDVIVTNVGFHDVDYHSGEPYALDDWPAAQSDGNITWSTQPFAENENANALRWGTLYNFRFDADTPPQPADITIGLFKPGTPTDVTVSAMAPAEPLPIAGPDVIVGSIPNVRHWTSGGAVDGLRAYSLAITMCNAGTVPLDWFIAPSPRHPVNSQNLYRLKNGRIEQIGQSWVKHGFCALQQNLCESCSPPCGGCCDTLGAGCSSPSSASRQGSFANLGPKSEINAHLGTNLGEHAFPEGDTTLRGRIQVRETDLDPALNPQALYFAETQVVAADDAQTANTTGQNNASYRQVRVILPLMSLSTSGGTTREQPAIRAWQVDDPEVTIQNVDIPDEGRLILAYRVTDNGDGTWHYEYALHNLNSDRSAGSFVVPVPEDVTVTNVGFHDVDYHSGEPYTLDDWPAAQDGSRITWSTQSFAENENANALRWGTLYNFRFDADTPPQPADITIGLFKPGAPTQMTVPALGPAESCPAPAFALGAAGVSFADRAFDGFIDARAESTDGINVNLGLDTFTIEFNTPLENLDGSPLDAGAFAISDTGGTAPSITNFTTEDSRTVTLALSSAIAVQQWTIISVHARAECDADAVVNDAIQIGFLPADIDQSGAIDPFDLLAFRQFANNVSAPSAGVLIDFLDANRDDSVTPFDLLAFRQLINGTPPATRPWAGESLPPASE